MFLYVDFTASFTKFIFFVFDNISLFIIKLIIITIIIALIPSIEIATFVYLINNENDATNPTNDILANIPDFLYITQYTNNVITNIAIITIAK